MSSSATSLDDQVRRMTPVAAPADQREETAAVFRLLEQAGRQHPSMCRLVGPDGLEIVIPEAVSHAFELVAEVLARGDAVTVLPAATELTVAQAADILNVSRQYLVRLLDQEVVPSTPTGTHRQVRVDDLLRYKQQRDRERGETLDELTQVSQDMRGYDELP
jgi:excisionase family DNA binding protein